MRYDVWPIWVGRLNFWGFEQQRWLGLQGWSADGGSQGDLGWALGRLLSCWNWENFSCLQVDELQLSCLFFNPGYQPATSTYLSKCACHLPLVNMRPTSWQHKKSLFNPGFFIGLWNLATDAPGVALCFLYTRHPLAVKDSWHPWFSQTPGSFWADVTQVDRVRWTRSFLDFPKYQVSIGQMPGTLRDLLCISVSFSVIGSLRSVCTRLYARDRGGDCSLD